jgi:hypothetical protein
MLLKVENLPYEDGVGPDQPKGTAASLADDIRLPAISISRATKRI